MTSVYVEHVFSKGHLVLSHVHNRLSVESTHSLLCLGAWSKLSLINKADIKATTNLPDVKEGDEDYQDEFDRVL